MPLSAVLKYVISGSRAMTFNIFVEGEDDQELITALLSKMGKTGTWRMIADLVRQTDIAAGTITVYQTRGWTKLNSEELQPLLQQGREVGIINLIVFDADSAANSLSGFVERQAELTRQAVENQLDFELFLLLTNSTDGNLEDLLAYLVQPEHRQVLECFSTYEACMRGCVSPSGQPYRLPAEKSRFFAYVEAMPLTGAEKRAQKSRAGNKFFANPAYWNLDATEIQPLRDFLNQYIR